MPENAPSPEDKREKLFAAVAVELGRVSAEHMARAQRRAAELAGAGQRLRLGEILLADKIIDKDAALEILRETRLRMGEAPALPGYRVESLLGSGISGPVFLARQESLDRRVALRVFSRRVARDPSRLARVEKAARAVSRLAHPRLAAGIDYGEAGGYPYFAMEYVDGENLAQRLQRERRLPESAALAVALPAAEALAHAASQGIHHGALRPSSFLFDADGGLKLSDLESGPPAFGNAAAARYAAPQLRAAFASDDDAGAGADGEFRSDPHADQYALGAILYEAMSGQPWKPRAAADPEPTPLHQLDLAVGRGGSAVVARLTRYRPEERYADWDEVLVDLRQLSENRLPRHAHPAKMFRGESAAAPGAAARQLKALKRKNTDAWNVPLLLAAMAAVVALVFHFGGRGGFSARPEPPPPFAPRGPDAPALRARALWGEAQAARRAWEKAGGQQPSSFDDADAPDDNPANAAGAGGADANKADGSVAARPPPDEPPAARTARETMRQAYSQLLAPEFSALAYGKAARRQMRELGLPLDPPPSAEPPIDTPVDTTPAGDAQE